MSSETALLLILLIPLAGAVLIALSGAYPNVREGITLVSSLL